MPAKSKKQQRYMGMLAHDPKKRKEAGISKKVAEEFAHKPEGGYKKEAHGDLMKRMHGGK